MTTFNDRKDAFESKFAHDEELRFKAMARRNKLFGLWAAGQLGQTGAEADAYAKSVVVADFEEAGDDDVLRKVRKDLEAGGKSVSDVDLRRTMDQLLAKQFRRSRRDDRTALLPAQRAGCAPAQFTTRLACLEQRGCVSSLPFV
jgi:hypothetical protein